MHNPVAACAKRATVAVTANRDEPDAAHTCSHSRSGLWHAGPADRWQHVVRDDKKPPATAEEEEELKRRVVGAEIFSPIISRPDAGRNTAML